jgi:hypothetical protein
MANWLKLGYFTELHTTPDYWPTIAWVSDSPGRVSPRWKHHARPRAGKRHPVFGPQYHVGDRLVMYLTEIDRCPAILEVTDDPRWDPATVDAAHAGEGDRWGVVTPVRCIHAASGDVALGDIGVAKSSISRKGHIRLLDRHYAEAERLITGRAAAAQPPGSPHHALVPIEAGHVEGYDITTAATVRRAARRESRLVHDYARHLERGGDSIGRLEIRPTPGHGALYSDVLNTTRHQLVEAKASGDRTSVRMAIGQLADYARFIDPPPQLAVLLEAKPDPDLEQLLSSQDIAVIWPRGERFHDNAGGRFV